MSLETINFYEIQRSIIEQDRDKFGIFLGTGVGKTLTALVLANGRTIVIAPKQQKVDRTWERNNEKFSLGKDLTVVSKEEFRRDWETYGGYDTVIIDECHTVLGVLPETRQRNRVQIPKTSQIFEAVLLYLQKHPPNRFYPCSATPVTKPMHMWALAKLFGTNWDFYKFRQTFYFPILMGRRQIWLPRKDNQTKDRLAGLVNRFGYTGALADFVDVPEQTHLEVKIDLTDPQKRALKELSIEEADPLVKRARQRTIENGVLYGKKLEAVSHWEDKMVSDTTIFPSGKIDYILERAVEFPKMLIFANYTAQIMEIEKALKKNGYKVSTLTGKTKDRSTLIQEAEKDEEHIVVAQSSISSGYELPSTPCMIFASKSFRFVDYEQALGRVLRINKLKKNLYIHLIVDGADEDCHKTIMSGADFQEKISVL